MTPAAFNPMALDGLNIVITGAGQGVGLCVAQHVLRLGGNVTAIDMNEDGLAGFAQASPAGRVLTIRGDVAEPAFAPDAVARSVEKFGVIHGLVNNAGITRAAMIDKMSLEAWRQVIDVNLSGSFLFLQAVGRSMIARAREGNKTPGAIVNVSSIAGRRGTVGQINYGAAKSGVLGLTMSAAREWARFGIRVNSVCFGMVETAMTEAVRAERFRDQYLAQIPLGRFSTPDDVSPAVCFLLSEAACYITGQHLSIDGGLHIGF